MSATGECAIIGSAIWNFSDALLAVVGEARHAGSAPIGLGIGLHAVVDHFHTNTTTGQIVALIAIYTLGVIIDLAIISPIRNTNARLHKETATAHHAQPCGRIFRVTVAIATLTCPQYIVRITSHANTQLGVCYTVFLQKHTSTVP